MSTTQAIAERVPHTTPHLPTERLAALRDLIPEAFTEGRIDWENLGAALGDLVDERPERYAFTWAGKRDAIRMLPAPSRATLVADREASVNFDATEHVFIGGDALGRDDLFVCRDAALDDEAAANLALQCRLRTL